MKYLLTGTLVAAIVLIGVWFCLFYLLFPLRYTNEINAAATAYDVEPALIAAVINAESSFNKNKVSPKNAIGLMQVLPSTAEYITQEPCNLFDAADNITVGTQYLAYLIDKFGDVNTALFAYNAGEGNVTRWLNEQQVEQLTTCPFAETNAYVAKVQKGVKLYRGRI